MESSSVRPVEAATSEAAVPAPTLTVLTMLGTDQGGDVCGVDGTCR